MVKLFQMKLPPQHVFKRRGFIDQCVRCGKWSDDLYAELDKEIINEIPVLNMTPKEVVMAYSYCLTEEELVIRDVLT